MELDIIAPASTYAQDLVEHIENGADHTQKLIMIICQLFTRLLIWRTLKLQHNMAGRIKIFPKLWRTCVCNPYFLKIEIALRLYNSK